MYKPWILILVVLSLCACVSKEEQLSEWIAADIPQVERSLANLKSQLDAGKLTNARKLESYANAMRRAQPQYASLFDNMSKNALSSGPMFQSLEERLREVKTKPGKSITELEKSLNELYYLKEAAQPKVFNDALSDSVNVLADMSGGKLDRVQAVSRRTEKASNPDINSAPGSQLIGNPQYGQWVDDGSGGFMWQWFAAYWLFDEVLDLDDVFERKRYYGYSSWSYRRPYSYYHDYGRYRYTSPKRIQKQSRIEQKTAKNYRQSGKRFNSPYAKKRTGASRLSSVSQTRPSSGSFRKASSYRNSSTSSSRRGYSRTSRGPSRGK
ncbi:CHAD domain-containing protein [Pleionea sediminis]|uniref:CHAD domain-containing protein n=1 Tax=Pleionea sediminis TaxID=2569479 RepID=UPI001184DCE7|nr:CHAD domain-containing protein [Pleionea sediminis]